MSVRHHKKLGILVALTALATLMVFGTGSALAAAPDVVGPGNGPFLSPSVGQGVVHNPHGAGQLPGDRYTFLPGHNQAGANANALNTLPAAESPGPGNGNSDWSPIWPN